MSRARASILIHQSDAIAMAAELSRFEGLRTVESREEADPQWQALADAYADRVERMIDLALKVNIKYPEPPVAQVASPQEDGERIDREIGRMERVAEDWQNRNRKAGQTLERLELLLQGMHRLEPLDIPIGEFLRVRYLHMVIGYIKREQWERLNVLLFRTPAVFIPLFETGRELVTVAATDREHAPLLDRVLHSIFFQPFEWPENLNGTPAEVAARLKEQLNRAQDEYRDIQNQRIQLAEDWQDRLQDLQGLAQRNLEITRFLSRCAYRQGYYFVNCTISDKKPKQLADLVEQTARQPHAVFTTAPAGESE